MRPSLIHCTNMSSFPAANTGSLDVQLWLHARFVQEGWRERHASRRKELLTKYQVAKLQAVQIYGQHADLLWWWCVWEHLAPPTGFGSPRAAESQSLTEIRGLC
jgi:hypothetical protein